MNHFSRAGSDLSGSPVIRWPVSIEEALPGGTSSPSISLGFVGDKNLHTPSTH